MLEEEELTGLLVCITGVELRCAQTGRTGRGHSPGVSKQLRSAFYHA